MTKPLAPLPDADDEAYPVTRSLFRGLFFMAIVVVGAGVLGTAGYVVDHQAMAAVFGR